MKLHTRGLAMAALILMAPMALAACASITPPAPATPAQTVYDIKAALVAAEDIALGYEQARCGTASPCTAPGAPQINQAIITADAAVNAAEAAVRANGSDTSAIAVAQSAVQVLQALIAQYTPAPAATAPAATN